MIKLPNIALNAAVHSMACRVWHKGYDLCDSDDPNIPDNPWGYWTEIERRGRPTIYTGYSDNTIFGEPEFNWDFRAWHDWTHYILKAPFTLTGELAVAHRQCEDIATVFDHYSTIEWQRLIMADVYGQALFFQKTKQFPVYQKNFDLCYCDDPRLAIDCAQLFI